MGKRIRNYWRILCILSLFVIVPIHVSADDGVTEVATEDEFVAAMEDDTVKTVLFTADIDLDWPAGINSSTRHIYDITDRIIDLNGHTLSARNMAIIYQGSNFTIKNGFVDSKGGSYALFIGDEGTTDQVLVEDITATGGFNIYNSTNVVLRNVNVTGMDYYTIWCDENAHATIESGKYVNRRGVAVIGMSITDTDLEIKGGHFETNGLPLVLKGTNADGSAQYNKPIFFGGSFDQMPDAEYLAEGFHPVDDGTGNFVVKCAHTDTEIRNAKTADCTNDGYSGDVYCTNCHDLLEKGHNIPATGHHFNLTWFSDDTKHWHRCDCGEIGEVAYHNLTWIIDQEPTLEATGSKHKECTICDYQGADVEIAKLTEETPADEKNETEDSDSVIKDTNRVSSLVISASVILSLIFISVTVVIGRKKKA